MTEDEQPLARRRAGDRVRPAGRHRPPCGKRGHGFRRQPDFGPFALRVGLGAADADGAFAGPGRRVVGIDRTEIRPVQRHQLIDAGQRVTPDQQQRPVAAVDGAQRPFVGGRQPLKDRAEHGVGQRCCLPASASVFASVTAAFQGDARVLEVDRNPGEAVAGGDGGDGGEVDAQRRHGQPFGRLDQIHPDDVGLAGQRGEAEAVAPRAVGRPGGAVGAQRALPACPRRPDGGLPGEVLDLGGARRVRRDH
ncbi:hypothetical protein DS837_00115 [Azospirillum brasilense]|uniref:Uncharacterized protein n=1 Tax=Azospirillum brasilense TaxID=192 RepID=A0A6L3B908_AZOBR|nr:hypothetical protein DS837_00115 [Azospirillum brasilense]